MYSMCQSCFFQAEDGIRDLVRSRGLGDVYKRQIQISKYGHQTLNVERMRLIKFPSLLKKKRKSTLKPSSCLLYTSDAADERSSVDLGGRRIIKKNIIKKKTKKKQKKIKKKKKKQQTMLPLQSRTVQRTREHSTLQTHTTD